MNEVMRKYVAPTLLGTAVMGLGAAVIYLSIRFKSVAIVFWGAIALCMLLAFAWMIGMLVICMCEEAWTDLTLWLQRRKGSRFLSERMRQT